MARLVEGWLSTYAVGVKNRLARTLPDARQLLLNTDPTYGIGTTEFMRSQGGYAITLECGQHADPLGVQLAYQAIRNTLAQLGLTDETQPEPRPDHTLLRLAEVIDRHHADDSFAKAWQRFDAVKAGELIGTRHNGAAVAAPRDGYVVFPNAVAQPGNEWFYFAQLSDRIL